MRKALIGLVLLPALAACGGGGSSSPAATAPATQAAAPTVAQPSAAQVAQVKDLAAKLGCGDVTVTRSTDEPVAADTECTFGADPADPPLAGLPTEFNAQIDAYASQADRDAALARLNSAGHFRGAQGATWIVTCDEDPKVEQRVVKLTGGQQLNAL